MAKKEDKIIELCGAGDKKAQETLFKEYFPYVYKISFAYVQNTQDAEDNTLTAMMNVFANLDKFDSTKAEFRFWVRRITVNACISFLHKNRRLRQEKDIENYTESQDHIATEDHALKMDIKQIIGLVESLPSPQREVVKLQAMEGFTHIEISEILGISEKYSRLCLHMARKKLTAIVGKTELSKMDKAV